ncbi:peptidoglycan-binding domain-containing protein, partial [Bartonella henselae]
IKKSYLYTQKNTLFFVGFIIFIVSFGFFSFNALFLQMKTHQNVFTQMKFMSGANTNIEKNSALFLKEEKFQSNRHVTSLLPPNYLKKNSSSHSASQSILEMQKKLAKLGLYDGSLDGLEGPKTRRAIALWKQQTAEEMQNRILQKNTKDEIAILIKQSEMEMINEKTKTKDLPRSTEPVLEPTIADIIEVQKALRIFGNQEVIVTGVEDQKTVEALKQFQKMFDLPITGKINHTVLVKMHEIGLLN